MKLILVLFLSFFLSGCASPQSVTPKMLEVWNDNYAGEITAYSAWLGENLEDVGSGFYGYNGGDNLEVGWIQPKRVKNYRLRKLTMKDLKEQPAFEKAIKDYYNSTRKE